MESNLNKVSIVLLILITILIACIAIAHVNSLIGGILALSLVMLAMAGIKEIKNNQNN